MQSRNHALDEAEIPGRERGFHPTGVRIEHGGIEDAIAVKKDRGPGDGPDHGPNHLADSHFISLARR